MTESHSVFDRLVYETIAMQVTSMRTSLELEIGFNDSLDYCNSRLKLLRLLRASATDPFNASSTTKSLLAHVHSEYSKLYS